MKHLQESYDLLRNQYVRIFNEKEALKERIQPLESELKAAKREITRLKKLLEVKKAVRVHDSYDRFLSAREKIVDYANNIHE